MFKLQNITYTLPDQKNKKHLLKDISLNISKGSMLAIMGLNGAGKTTLLKILSSYLKPNQGSVFVEEKNTNTYNAKDMARKTAFVPQEFPTNFPFTVSEFVMMGRFSWQKSLLNQQEDFQTTTDTLKKLNLFSLKNRDVSTLSGGEKQRVLLARAIVQNTEAILLDEPFNHLDIKNKREILSILKNLNQNHGKTIIAVMHSFSDVSSYFHQVVFLKNSVLMFCGNTKEAFEEKRLQEVFDVPVYL